MERRTFIRSVLVASGMAFVGGAAYAYQSSTIEISRKRIFLPTLKKKLRIVAGSDIHLPSSFLPLENLVKLINLESPDIFILAGDTVDRRGSEGLVREFESVEVSLARLAMLGNWEYWGQLDLTRLKKVYEEAGFSLLVNNLVEISGLTVVGLDDFLCGSPEYELLKNVPANPILVVSHCPEGFDLISAISPNPVMTISGHTHGGQIAPFGVVFYTPRGSGSYLQGWYRRGGHTMYVMRGVGTSGIPLRIGAKPELLVLDLVGDKA